MNINSSTDAYVPSLRALWKEAFGDTDEFLDSFFDTAYSHERSRCITEGEKAVAALYWFDCEWNGKPVAYIYAVATLQSHRGKGLCNALMKDTHQHLLKLGYDGAILVPGSTELFWFYGKMGYKNCSFVKKITETASSGRIEIEKIDSLKYTELRRKFLPENSVVQENENIAFLETMFDFYTGDNFLMAAKKKGDILYVAELLGEEDKAPSIVGSVNCKKGIFRCPGNDLAFAMYLPLNNQNFGMPAYFGFAFD